MGQALHWWLTPWRAVQEAAWQALNMHQWPTGVAVVNEAPYVVKEAAEPVDLSTLPRRD